MTNYDGYNWPEPEFYKQSITGSLDDGLARWDEWRIWDVDDLITSPLYNGIRARGSYAIHSDNFDGFVQPEWSDLLFGHILVVPSRLQLGNVLTNQTRSVEIANLFLSDVTWQTLGTDVQGLTFTNAPAGMDDTSSSVPYDIPSFGSFVLQVGISAEGPAVISGDIFFGMNVEFVTVPVEGRRVVSFHFKPLAPITEVIEWKTDIITAEAGNEQRVTLRGSPRQQLRMAYMPVEQRSKRRIDGLLFDWIDKIFAVPIWYEATYLTGTIAAGSLSVPCDTSFADYRIGSLAMVYLNDEHYDIFEVASIDSNGITSASEIIFDYGVSAQVMPVRQAYARTAIGSPRYSGKLTRFDLEFVTIENEDLASTAGEQFYDSKVIIKDCVNIQSGADNAWQRNVIVIDAETGRLQQTSLWDRSKLTSKIVWDARSYEELWRVRQLLHAFHGSRVSFFMPTFTEDIKLANFIGAGAESMEVEETGLTAYMQGRRPFGDIRLVKTDGTEYIRPVASIVLDPSGTEVLSFTGQMDPSNPIYPADVERIEWVNLVRIADDKATILHRYLQNARIEVNIVTTRE